jgi:hypothetical protein
VFFGDNMRYGIRKIVAPLILAAGLVGLVGCEGDITEKEEYSRVLHEDAKVEDVVFTPSRHGDGSGFGIGPTIDFDGNLGIAFSSSSVDVNIPEKYAVVFECQHGKFIVQGTGAKHKELWSRLHEGELVDVSYREVYKRQYIERKGGALEQLGRPILKDYWFLDAQPKTTNIIARKN